MTVTEIIYKLLIGPLELFFEVVFVVSERYVGNPAVSIIMLSLAMNFLVLPLYKRADEVQAKQRDIDNRLAPWIKHIKKTFKGDEQFMMLQAYYRQNNYKPTDSLKGSISLLLEIPFFIAAYHFLSNLQSIRGVPLGPIADLGAPDALIVIGDISINVLPILMTFINIISAMIYLKGFPIKSKIQTYSIAAIFLVFLYKSPAGLVFYWTLNNLFSLIKNVFYRFRDPSRIVRIIASLAGVGIAVFTTVIKSSDSPRMKIVMLMGAFFLQLPLLKSKIDFRILKNSGQLGEMKTVRAIYFSSALMLAVLAGLLIPSAVIKGSATEFVVTSYYVSPIWYIGSAFALSIGTFIIWCGIFYGLASEDGKRTMSWLMASLAISSLINYMFFGKNYGNFSNLLQFDVTPVTGSKEMIANTAAVVVAVITVLLIYRFRSELLAISMVLISTVLITMMGINVAGIIGELNESSGIIKHAAKGNPEINLSKDGRNVVVIMMDRQIGHFIPYIIDEKPELKKTFEGFKYYSNAFSYGLCTIFGAPGLYGGYEYIPEEMNRRSGEKLSDKHNEALKVMPKMFSDAGYKVTILDPPYAGYSWIADLSVFDDIADTSAYITNGRYSIEEYNYDPPAKSFVSVNKRNFFCYSLFKMAPLFFQPTLYERGTYNAASGFSENTSYSVKSLSCSSGYNAGYMNAYAVLYHLKDITRISTGDGNTFTMMSNDSTHETTLLQEPEYKPSTTVDNTAFYSNDTLKATEEGKEISFDNDYQVSHYHINMGSMIELGKWMDYLKENGVYDNTRIIIVSDHGRDMGDGAMPVISYTNDEGEKKEMDTSFFDCVLLVKDFDSHEFVIDDNLISNADTPAIASDGLIEHQINPYTGKALTRFKDLEQGETKIFGCFKSEADAKAYVFPRDDWFIIRNNIYYGDSWEYAGSK